MRGKKDVVKFIIYDGDCEVTFKPTEDMKQLVFDRIVQYMKENDCISGETLHQADRCIFDAPNVLSDIIDDIIKPDSEWIN